MSKVSVCMIVYNEEELLPDCLSFLESMENIQEICIVDSFSNDITVDLIEEFAKISKKEVKLKQHPFKSFSEQRNISLEMATGDWVLTIDADETYSWALDKLLKDLDTLKSINAIRIPTIILVRNTFTVLEWQLDPHIRIFRRGFATLEKELHEMLVDKKGRELHNCVDPDILNTLGHGEYGDVVLKHAQLLKSDRALAKKGIRWMPFMMESRKTTIRIHPRLWLDIKEKYSNSKKTYALPRKWYDITTRNEVAKLEE